MENKRYTVYTHTSYICNSCKHTFESEKLVDKHLETCKTFLQEQSESKLSSLLKNNGLVYGMAKGSRHPWMVQENKVSGVIVLGPFHDSPLHYFKSVRGFVERFEFTPSRKAEVDFLTAHRTVLEENIKQAKRNLEKFNKEVEDISKRIRHLNGCN